MKKAAEGPVDGKLVKQAVMHEETRRTAWIGGLPLALASDEPALHKFLSRYGELETLTIRVKEDKPYGSWCMASYAHQSGENPLDKLRAAPIPVPREPGHKLKKATKVIMAANAFAAAGAQAASAHTGVEDEEDEDDPEPVLIVKQADVKGQMKKKKAEGTVGALAAQAEIHEEKRRSLREQLEENMSKAQKEAVAKQYAAETKKTSTRQRSRLRRFRSKDGSVSSMFSSSDIGDRSVASSSNPPTPRAGSMFSSSDGRLN